MTTDEWKEKAVRLSCGHEWMVDFVAQALAEAYRKGVEDSAKICEDSTSLEHGFIMCNMTPHQLAEAIRKLSKEAK